jgi:hypothetical protein
MLMTSDCVFTINATGVLEVRIFDTYNSGDYLHVTTSSGTEVYHHSSGPDGVIVNPGDELIWITNDRGTTSRGFDICIV